MVTHQKIFICNFFFPYWLRFCSILPTNSSTAKFPYGSEANTIKAHYLIYLSPLLTPSALSIIRTLRKNNILGDELAQGERSPTLADLNRGESSKLLPSDAGTRKGALNHMGRPHYNVIVVFPDPETDCVRPLTRETHLFLISTPLFLPFSNAAWANLIIFQTPYKCIRCTLAIVWSLKSNLFKEKEGST